MSTLSALLRATGLSVDDLLRGDPTLTRSQCRAVGIDDAPTYLHAFRSGYDLGDEFFPRIAPRGDYLLGWNHGREARAAR